MATVCDTELSPPSVGAGCTIPSSAEPVPVWTCALLALGVTEPSVVQDASPLSKPLLSTCNALDDGVTALELDDSGPLPAGFEAVTVNV
jgi:hypothetical protein